MADIRLDHAGLARSLKTPEVDAACHRLAEAIADGVRLQGFEVGDTSPGVTRRIPLPVEVGDDNEVILAHPAGEAVEAKYGALVKGAAIAGVEVHR